MTEKEMFIEKMKKSITIVSLILFATNLAGQQGLESELIFPLQEQHVHSSSIIELPNGDLLTCWFQGSGERTANDVVINGSRLKKGNTKWSEPFLMADSPGQPDCNPILFLNNSDKLFLVWIVVKANRWETSILKVRTTTDYDYEGVPNWEWQDVILMKPGVEFEKRVKEQFEKYGREDLAWAEYALPYEKMLVEAAKDPKKRETGWMTRTHPIILKNGKILLPLYSDGFNFGLIAISEDEGETWESSLPIVGRGLNQPSLVVRNDGSIDAYMRDDGDEPGRILISHSDDEGYSWSYAQKSEIPNPGASVEVIKLKSGNWLLVYNDVDDGRYSIAAAISDDEGKSWKWKKKLENLKGGSFSYPSVIQAKDGRIHITYSYHLPGDKKSIKHIAFEENMLLFMGYATSRDMPDRGICAHRGAMNTHPENTLAAFREAVRLGAHMIELDVRMTKNGHLVILHDETVDRTTNGKGKISELTIDEVKHLDAGSWKSNKFSDERIPTLKEALAIMPEDIWLNIHIKGGERAGIKVARVIVDENRVHQAFLACESDAANGAKEISRDIMICNMERQDDRNEYIDETIRQKSQFIQLLRKRTSQDTKFEIATLKQHNIRINYCCTDSSDEVKTLLKSGVDFILTNKLAEMLEAAESVGIKPLKH